MNAKALALLAAIYLAVCWASLKGDHDGASERVESDLVDVEAVGAFKMLDANMSVIKGRLDTAIGYPHRPDARAPTAERGSLSKLLNQMAASIDEAHGKSRALFGEEDGVSLVECASRTKLCCEDLARLMISTEVYLAFLEYWTRKIKDTVHSVKGDTSHQEEHEDQLGLPSEALVAKLNAIILILDANADETNTAYSVLSGKAAGPRAMEGCAACGASQTTSA